MTSNPTTPKPYIVAPAPNWDGIDGNWSTFRISVGRATGSDDGQDFRVLVSTRGSAAWVPTSAGCPESFHEGCPASRGVETFRGQQSHGFQDNSSYSWVEIDTYDLGLESNLGFKDRGGTFGYDTVRLGSSGDPNHLQVNKTLVVEYGEPAYWMGLLGLGNVSERFTSDQPIDSLIKTLSDTGAIPSQSYGYTAGAYYRYPKVPGSLVIGGYDQSRFQLPAYSFPITTSTTSDQFLAVNLQSVHTDFSFAAAGTGSISLLQRGHSSVIDSTVSQLWLPGTACDMFQKAFGLTYDEEKNYYLINDTTHDKLLAKNTSLTFTFGRDVDAGSNDTIQIKLPYAAFDHFIDWPAYVNNTRYFPIRRAANDTQNTIGRVLLQEAYLTVNYENRSFSIAQANFSDTIPDPYIHTIHPANWVSPTASSSLSGGAKAGISIGVVAGVLLLFSAIYLYWWRPRRQKKKAHNKRPSVVSQAPTYLSSADPPPHYYREGKEPYDPHFGAQQQQQQHMGYERQHSVSEMPAGADNQARRPELDGVNVGGSSYELPAPVKERDEDVVVYEMGVGHEAASDADQDSAEVESEQVERRGSEQRRPSEPPRPSQVETPPA